MRITSGVDSAVRALTVFPIGEKAPEQVQIHRVTETVHAGFTVHIGFARSSADQLRAF